jgi:hypothetical protein
MEIKPKKPSFFDCLNSINEGARGKDMFADPSFEEKFYLPFMVNRGLSWFSDTVLFANEMNRRYDIPVRAQYEFLRKSIRPRKRFSKWLKNERPDSIDLIKAVYGYSTEKARQVLPLLTEEQLKALQDRLEYGGRD